MKNYFCSTLFIFLVTFNSCKSENKDKTNTKKTNIKLSDHKGIYISSNGELIIDYNEKQEINFEIITANQSCTGDIKGILKTNSNGQAKYSDSECESLLFDFKINEITITEKNCDSNHGIQCSFEGVYKKEL